MPTNDHPMASDNRFQRLVHSGHHARRRELVGMLIAEAEHAEQSLPLDQVSLSRKIAGKLCNCGRMPTVWQDADSGDLLISRAMCRSRLCPTCGKARSARLRADVLPLIKDMDAARMMTLTLAATDDPLADQIARLLDCWKRLRRRKIAQHYIRGGMYVLEITYNKQTDRWHPHLHVVFDGAYWPQARIADLWEAITTDSRIVDIRAVHSREAVAAYISKYVSKCQTPRDAPARRVSEWAEAVHGLRMIQTFGCFHGRKINSPPSEDRGPLEHVIPLEPLLEAAANGDETAQKLKLELGILTRYKLSTDQLADVAEHAARCRQLAGELRSWWAGITGNDSGFAPPGLAARAGANHADQRTIWGGQVNDPPSRLGADD